MLQEIYYTSAQRGLKPGSRGFCTVVSTAGMAKNLAERLESLSGYRHVFAPQDARAALNPLAAMHLRLSVAGRPCHVLSRICDAGLDYTQRTNKFAHHVVLDEGELLAAGPAWLLTTPGFMQSTWDGEPRTLPPGRRVPAGNSTAGVCRGWQKLTGDAGWGGVLAETALLTSQRQAVIVFAPGMDVLALVQESLALLPPRLRWSVTFSTYYTKLPPGVECKWRFVVEGSPEAQAARATPQTLLLQLGAKLPPAIGGSLVEAARTGVAPVVADSPRAEVAMGGATNASLEELESMLADSAQEEVVGATGVRATFSLGPPPVPGDLEALGSLPPSRVPTKRKKNRLPLIGAGAAAVAILVGAAIAGTVMLRGSKEEIAKVQGTPEPTEELKPSSPLVSREAPMPTKDQQPPQAPAEPVIPEQKAPEPDPTPPAPDPPNSPPPPLPKPAQAPAADTGQAKERHAATLELDYSFSIKLDENGRQGPFQIPPNNCKLELFTSEHLKGGSLACIPSQRDGGSNTETNVLFIPTGTTKEDGNRVGTFTQSSSQLWFEWNPGIGLDKKMAVCMSRLDITDSVGDIYRVFLRAPIEANALKLNEWAKHRSTKRQLATKFARHPIPGIPLEVSNKICISIQTEVAPQPGNPNDLKSAVYIPIDQTKYTLELAGYIGRVKADKVLLDVASSANISLAGLPVEYHIDPEIHGLVAYLSDAIHNIEKYIGSTETRLKELKDDAKKPKNAEDPTFQTRITELDNSIAQAHAQKSIVEKVQLFCEAYVDPKRETEVGYEIFLPLGDDRLVLVTTSPFKHAKVMSARKGNEEASK